MSSRVKLMMALGLVSLVTSIYSAQGSAQGPGIDPALMAKATSGNAEAEFRVGTKYELGANVPKDRPIDGVNLMPHITGKGSPPPHDLLYWRTGGGDAFAVRQGNMKLVKIGNRTELYDLEADIGESKDLADTRADVLKRLDAARERWSSQMMAPRFPSPQGPRKKKG